MRIIRGLAAAVIAACTGLVFSGPAHADQVMEGVYDYTSEGATGTYTIWPSCVPVVGDLREPLNLPVACRLHVDTSSAALTGGIAYLTGGVWQINTNRPAGMQCPDGSWAATTETIKIDDLTMTGTRTIFHNDVCGLQPGMITTPFTLSYKGPLPYPIERYPLYCEPAGLRICQ